MFIMRWLAAFGRYLQLMGRVMKMPERWRMFMRQYVREMGSLGVDSIGIVLLISFFIGAVICIQIKLNIQSPWMPTFTTGYTTREIMLLEFSSSIMCLILAGKVGSNIASEIGTMRVTQQIDALEIMGVNSASFLILPKVMGMMSIIPFLVVFSIVSGFGTVEIAANGIANNLDTLGLLFGFAVNLAAITVIGQCVGAGDEAQVRYYTKKILRILYIVAAAFNLLLILFLDQILLIYQVTPETRALANILVLIHNGGAILMWPIAFTLPNILRACNDVTYTMVTGVFAMFAFRIALGYVFGVVLGYGSVGVWIAMMVDWIFRTVCYLYRYWHGTWRKHAHFV